MGKYLFSLIFICVFLRSYSQGEAYVKGRIIDLETEEPLTGVQVKKEDGTGTVSDINGNYGLAVPTGKTILEYTLIGYTGQKDTINARAGDTIVIDIELIEAEHELKTVVISAGRFEQEIEDVTVSMAVLKPDLIQSRSTVTPEQILDQVPGVSFNESQVSIRGGSGFAYGAGSRVMMMVDGMPILSADAGDVKWNNIPLENVAQIEVIKGASSVLYGSSALNGVIHVRTAEPGPEPLTKVNVYHGVYGDPLRETNRWWKDHNPRYVGANFMHSRQIRENFDLTIGGNVLSDEGYREGEFENRGRFNMNTRYRSKKIEGLSYGVNMNAQDSKYGLFIIWEDDSAVYQPQGGPDPEKDSSSTLSITRGKRLNVDPYITYVNENGTRHTLRTRYFRTNNINTNDQSSLAQMYYGEYQFQKPFDRIDLMLTVGATGTYNDVQSELYGDHYGTNFAGYLQLDKKLGRFNFSAGMRGEYFRIDTAETLSQTGALDIPIQPVFRAGMTYKPFEHTVFRASWGQGYRFPAIAEKFVRTSVGALRLFPNDTLQPETGWSAEVGVRQGLKLGKWTGYLDVAGFWTEYQNMVEFAFGIHAPPGTQLNLVDPSSENYFYNWVGFRAENAEEARIAGIDASIVGSGKLGPFHTTIMAGYTYMDPVTLNEDSVYLATFSDSSTDILKYRFKHLAKLDIQFDYKRFSLGFSGRYNSRMENIDKTFLDLQLGTLHLGDIILPGLPEYLEENNSGNLTFDARLSFRMNDHSSFSFLVNNLTNTETMGRPGDVNPPRTFIGQYSLRF